jgi:hypothetical protein
MFQSHKVPVVTIEAAVLGADTSKASTSSRTGEAVATAARASTKDAGRVHIGGGMMRFDTTKDTGRVHVGGGMMRF